MSKAEELFIWIFLLEQEIEALRSVLAEIDGDQLEYLQMIKANNMEAARHSLVRPSLI